MCELPTFVLSTYNQVFMLTEESITDLGDSVLIPRLPMNELLQLNSEVIHRLSNKRAVEYISGPVAMIGDIHGNLRELIRAFIVNGMLPKTKYVFLGDYVDRNEFSVEVITLLFSLYCLYPEHIVLLRGNHECRSTNANYGFKQQVLDFYHSEDLWESFNSVFDYLPIAAVVNNTYFCVHGGISPSITSVEKLASHTLPIYHVSERASEVNRLHMELTQLSTSYQIMDYQL
ncbi:Ser/Thr protein phosphatase, putative [Trichomonas vaginalis G3]|uniref:Serine/threonine-protein phosphatase n=1 Tax=Trichomonas vaginalis (strain ATCC PRA-98 / G3) TaxID=412133 RepID=A2F9J9_TRIV3|nr:serine threonine-protein phosphatase family [Trichomonas vaginalis G3]EAX98428.1 Ser/Thr protein phosphatase, putative [Trichomonas vaginalis G3]KAI5526274.1 serine threonine-protein phosphatase family [Trichomonas vaginalis G3]|eukprot:XP_001311358.1 Ser/Thr protein phosphatase [Trichomonas vaginalis G3]